MPFKSVFIAVVLGTALVLAALLVNAHRPRTERDQPSPALIEVSGKCAECHRRQTPAIVDQYERSKHASVGVNCLDCHRPVDGQAPTPQTSQQPMQQIPPAPNRCTTNSGALVRRCYGLAMEPFPHLTLEQLNEFIARIQVGTLHGSIERVDLAAFWLQLDCAQVCNASS